MALTAFSGAEMDFARNAFIHAQNNGDRATMATSRMHHQHAAALGTHAVLYGGQGASEGVAEFVAARCQQSTSAPPSVVVYNQGPPPPYNQSL